MRVDVWLVSFREGSTPAKTMAAIFGINLRDAMMLEWALPAVVGRNMSEHDAASAVRTLRGIGAKAEARPTDPSVPPSFELPFAPTEAAARESSMPGPEPMASDVPPPDSRRSAPKSVPTRRAVKLVKRVVSEVPAELELPDMGDDDLPSPPIQQRLPSSRPLPTPRPPPARPSPVMAQPAPLPARPAPPATRPAQPAPAPPAARPAQPAPARPAPAAARSAPAAARPAPAAARPAPAPRPAPARPQPAAARPSPSRAEEDRDRQRAPRRPPRDLPQDDLYDQGPPLELLHVERPRPVVRRSVRPSVQPRTPEKSSLGLKPLLPAIGALTVGAGAAFATLRRGQTAMLGTADLVGHVIDGVALACLGLALVFGFAAIFSKREHFNMTPGVMALILAVGAAYFLNQWRVPPVGPDAEVGGAVSGLITQSQVSLAGFDDVSARALVDSLSEAGAISVRGAAPVRFMGAQAFHGLAIELPPGPASRNRIIVAFRAAIARFGGSVTPDPTAIQTVWVVAL